MSPLVDCPRPPPRTGACAFRGAALVLLGLTSSGCLAPARYAGLVEAPAGSTGVLLHTPTGAVHPLRLGEDAALFSDLGGCGVVVEGPRLGRTVRVTSWTVTDAGDGSAPYIGVLDRQGMKWFVDDRQSGSLIELEAASLGGLEQHAGEVVLVAGYVAGPNRVNVVTWRVLQSAP